MTLRGQAVQDAAEKGDLACLQQVLQQLGAGGGLVDGGLLGAVKPSIYRYK